MSVSDGEIRAFRERVMTMKARMQKVKKFRERNIYEKHKIQDEAVQELIRILHLGGEIRYETLKKEFAKYSDELYQIVFDVSRSYHTGLHILQHPYHLPLIKQYYSSLDRMVQVRYWPLFQHLEFIFKRYAAFLKDKLIPNIDKQLNELDGHRSTSELGHFVAYIEYSNEEKRLMRELDDELRPIVGSFHKVVGTLKGALAELMDQSPVHTALEFIEDHKKAVALLVLGSLLASFILGESVPVFIVSFLGMRVVRWSRSALEIFGVTMEFDDAAERLNTILH
ncbi:hypothetical protein JW711_02385 [Candidatus Woesearchaeota archaeon]|nr:hypothetical protein [Candidatus Woesearchaeota archaeon]